MSTTSTVLNLTLPASDGSDPFSLEDDFLNNWAILDAAPGAFITSSEDLPTWGADQAGRMVIETDLGNLVYWGGAAWHNFNLIVANFTVDGHLLADVNFGGHNITDLDSLTATSTVTTVTLNATGTSTLDDVTVTDTLGASTVNTSDLSVTNVFVLDGVTFFVNAGSPIGVKTSEAAGDICIDTATPALWMSSAPSSDTDWTQVTS